MAYTVYGGGDVVVRSTLRPGSGSLPDLPVVGVRMVLPAGFERVAWYGRGPFESYWDRNGGADVGVYTSTVDGMFVPYVRPQETGNRTGVRWMALTNDDGVGLLVAGALTLDVSALHHTPEDLEWAAHPYELERRDEITLRVAYHQRGVGGDDGWSWRALPHEEFSLPADRTYDWAFRLSPLTGEEEAMSVGRRVYP
jgi:beta-galactosidase